MTTKTLTVAVLVGNKSDILLDNSSVKAYRAVTVNELGHFIKSKDIDIVIVEQVAIEEYNNLKEMIIGFIAEDNKAVFVYSKENDETTCGLADELCLEIFLNKDNMYRYIKSEYGTDIKPNITKREIDEADISEYDIFDYMDEETKTDEYKSEEQWSDKEDDIDVIDSDIKETDTDIEKTDADVDEPDTDVGKSTIEADKNGEGAEVYEQAQVEEINKLRGTISTLNKDIATYAKKVDRLTRENSSIELKNDALEREIEKWKKEIEDAEDRHTKYKETAEKKIEDVESKYKNYKEIEDSLRDLRIEHDELSERYDSLKEEIDRIKGEYVRVENENNELSDKLSSLEGELDETRGFLAATKEEQTKLNEELETAKNIINMKEAELKEAKGLLIDKENELLQIKTEKSELAESLVGIEEITDKIRQESADELKELRDKEKELLGEVEVLKLKLSKKEEEYNNIIEIAGTDENGIIELGNNNKILLDMNEMLKKQLEASKADIKQVKKEKILIANKMSSIIDENKQLKVTVKTLTTGINVGSMVKLPPCEYSARGIIITVFSCGSYGVTTTAMSIAQSLCKDCSVLYIDMDLVYPKASTWFNKGPLVSGIGGTSKNTGLGIFIDDGCETFIDNMDKIVFNIKETKAGRLDYLSGIYTKKDSVKLVSANYSALLNYCGSNYTYIIIDLGKLGYNEINDKIIKNISDAAFKKIVVSANSKYDTRYLRDKIENTGINLSDAVWLLNMSKDTSVDESIKKYVSPAEISIMPFGVDIQLDRLDFTKTRMTKGKLNILMDIITKVK